MQNPLGLGLSELIVGLGQQQQQQQQEEARVSFPEQEQQLKCPRCDSTNTKFCYYNNYNLSQPRHFCKSCRRYWTKGGTLRNIPVGGATRKRTSKRPLSDPNPMPSAAAARIFTLPNNSGGPGHGNSGIINKSQISDPGSGSASGETRNQDSDCFFGGQQNRWPDLAIYTSPDSRFE